MANYKVVDAEQLDNDLTSVADAIREKGGIDDSLAFPEGFVSAVNALELSGSGNGDDEITIDPDKTYIYVHLEEGRTSPRVCCCPNGTVTVDWGDGTTPDTLPGTSLTVPMTTPAHEYAEPGDYVITLTASREVGFTGHSSYGSNILCGTVLNNFTTLVYSYAIRKIIYGKTVNFSNQNQNGGYNLCGLQSISISNVDGSAIPTLHFSYCYALANVTILDGVNSIGASAFVGCYGIRYFDFSKRTSVPVLENVNAFNYIPNDFEIRVPAALYDEWIAATNWSTYASKIVAV